MESAAKGRGERKKEKSFQGGRVVDFGGLRRSKNLFWSGRQKGRINIS